MKIYTTLLILGLLTSGLFGQQETKVVKKIVEEDIEITKDVDVQVENGQKTVVITKTIGDNVEVMEWSGGVDEAMPAEIEAELGDIEMEMPKQEIRQKMKMIVVDEDGNEKIMEWDGNGEMPEAFKTKMEEHDIEIDADEGEPRKMMKMKFKDEDGNEEIIEWDGDGPMPEKLKEHQRRMRREKKGMHHWKDSGRAEKFNGRGYNHKYGKKAKLGVEIEDTAAGVVINDIIADSAAAKAGLQQGDIFSEVDDTKIDSMDRLFAELATHDPGDQIKIKVLRGGSVKKYTVTLR